MSTLTALSERFAPVLAWARTPAGEATRRWGRRLFTVGVVGYILYSLAQQGIDWKVLVRHVPRSPWFYLTWLGMYLALPFAEGILYRRLWGVSAREMFGVSIRKRVLNFVVSYSGEVYLLGWAKARLPSGTPVLPVVKDTVLLSAIASIASNALLLLGLLAFGSDALPRVIRASPLGWTPGQVYALLGALVAVFAVLLGTRLRKAVFSLPRASLWFIGGVHLARYAWGFGMQALHWASTVPGVPLRLWGALIGVQALFQQIPFFPALDLAFTAFVVQVSGPLGVPEADVAAMLLTRNLLDRGADALLFALAPYLVPRAEAHEAETSAPPADLA